VLEPLVPPAPLVLEGELKPPPEVLDPVLEPVLEPALPPVALPLVPPTLLPVVLPVLPEVPPVAAPLELGLEPMPLAPVPPPAPPVCAIVAADMANNAAAVAVTNSFKFICCSSEDMDGNCAPKDANGVPMASATWRADD
jgi:hypothetical protein